jgi:hypothetical protein
VQLEALACTHCGISGHGSKGRCRRLSDRSAPR